eukprot:s465_g12.t1
MSMIYWRGWIVPRPGPLVDFSLGDPFLILWVPFSWGKAALESSLTLIGWHISVDTWTVQVPSEKLIKIQSQLALLLKSPRVTLKELQSAIGRLLWLTSAWHHLRPLLIPLYRALQKIPLITVGVDHATFADAALDDSLVLRASLSSKHHSLIAGVRLQRVANTFVQSKSDLEAVHLKSRRVWVGLVDPSSPNRLLDTDAEEALKHWQIVLVSSPFCVSMRAPAHIHLTATADAWHHRRLLAWGVLPFFQMAFQYGSNFRSLCRKLKSSGPGSMNAPSTGDKEGVMLCNAGL